MLVFDQFVYTAASTSSKSGYQFIARSSGISEEIISQLTQYVFPLGIDSSKFKESRSLLMLKKNKIAFSKVRNIGIGYDGRSDTFYNHTIVMDYDDFKKLDNDSRVLENLYIENPTLQGNLAQLKIESQKIPLSLEGVDSLKSILPETLLALFNKDKLAIFDNQKPYLIQKILGLVPPSVRLISFSTLVNDIEKQSKYDFIITDRFNRSLLDKKFKIIDPLEKIDPSILKNDNFEESVNYILELIYSKQITALNNIYNEFENIPSSDFRTKITMLVFLEKMYTIPDKTKKQDFAYVILNCLKKFDENTTLIYFNKIKEFLHFEDIQRYAPEFEIKQILVNSTDNSIDKNNLENMLGGLSGRTSESHLKFLNQLYSIRKKEFIENGSALIFDCKYSSYRSVIYQFFVETTELHQSIFNTLDNKSYPNLSKQQIFEAIFIHAAKNKPSLILKLLDHTVFNLTDEYELKDFSKIIKELFETNSFINSSFEIRLKIINKIFQQLEDITKPSKTSGTLDLPNSTLKQLVKTSRIIKEFVDSISDNRDMTNQQKNEIFSLKENLTEFIEKNNPKDPPPWNPFSFFRWSD